MLPTVSENLSCTIKSHETARDVRETRALRRRDKDCAMIGGKQGVLRSSDYCFIYLLPEIWTEIASSTDANRNEFRLHSSSSRSTPVLLVSLLKRTLYTASSCVTRGKMSQTRYIGFLHFFFRIFLENNGLVYKECWQLMNVSYLSRT